MNETELLILAQQVEHQLKLDQLSAAQKTQFAKALDGVRKEIFARFDKMTANQKARGLAILETTQEMLTGVKKSMGEDIAKLAGEVSAESAKAHSKALSFGGKAAAVHTVVLSPALMATYWKDTPVGGVLLKDWVDKVFSVEM